MGTENNQSSEMENHINKMVEEKLNLRIAEIVSKAITEYAVATSKMSDTEERSNSGRKGKRGPNANKHYVCVSIIVP